MQSSILFIVCLFDQLSRISALPSIIFLIGLNLTSWTDWLGDVACQACLRIVLSYLENDRASNVLIAFILTTLWFSVNVCMIDLKVHRDHLGASWTTGPRNGRISLYTSINFHGFCWGSVIVVLIKYVNRNRRVMYLLSSLLTTGCIILRDKGLHMLPQAELDCCFKHLRLLMSVLLLQMRLPNWSSYLTVSTGYLRSGWVYLCLELLLLEIDSSFHLWLLKHHKLWLDCPAK